MHFYKQSSYQHSICGHPSFLVNTRKIPPAFSLYIFSADFLSAYRSFPEYPVTFYDINHFFMYAAYFIRVYSGEKVADCINFWNPSTDTVFQSFRHAFRG